MYTIATIQNLHPNSPSFQTEDSGITPLICFARQQSILLREWVAPIQRFIIRNIESGKEWEFPASEAFTFRPDFISESELEAAWRLSVREMAPVAESAYKAWREKEGKEDNLHSYREWAKVEGARFAELRIADSVFNQWAIAE